MTTPEQLAFDLPRFHAAGLDDFMVSPSNEPALNQVLETPGWPLAKLLLIGPEGSGKTHLAHVWAARAGASLLSAPPEDLAPDALPGALVLDDVDRLLRDPAAATPLFHLFNATAEAQVPLLLTARTAPARWPVALPDLASRLAQLNVAKLTQPDDMLLSAITAKQFLDRQLNVKPEVVTFITRRIDRSFAAISATVDLLDRAALGQGRAITIPFVRDTLDGH